VILRLGSLFHNLWITHNKPKVFLGHFDVFHHRWITHSERVAIGEAIEAELQGRNGIRHDTKPAMENFPQVEGATRDLAAKAAGNALRFEGIYAQVGMGSDLSAPRGACRCEQFCAHLSLSCQPNRSTYLTYYFSRRLIKPNSG
jgi:hypothetical protein